jgi:hypothetical protein
VAALSMRALRSPSLRRPAAVAGAAWSGCGSGGAGGLPGSCGTGVCAWLLVSVIGLPMGMRLVWCARCADASINAALPDTYRQQKAHSQYNCRDWTIAGGVTSISELADWA